MRYEIASARKRLGAFLIDHSLNLVVFIFSISYGSYVGTAFGWVFLGINVALIATKMSYWTVGTTLGKSYFGLKIVDKDSRRILGLQKMMLRQTIGMLVSFSVLNMGFIWIFIDRERQGWHDKIFNDLVIDMNRPIEEQKEDEFIHGY
jgi:uncharacterized RDD family membrane protein YckC